MLLWAEASHCWAHWFWLLKAEPELSWESIWCSTNIWHVCSQLKEDDKTPPHPGAFAYAAPTPNLVFSSDALLTIKIINPLITANIYHLRGMVPGWPMSQDPSLYFDVDLSSRSWWLSIRQSCDCIFNMWLCFLSPPLSPINFNMARNTLVLLIIASWVSSRVAGT